MFTIRKDQMGVLRDAFYKRLGEDVTAWVHARMPEETRQIERDQLDRLVRKSLEDAPPYGFRTVDEIGLYCEGMIRYGRDFDTDPRTPWVRTILLCRELLAQTRLVFVLGKLEG